MQFQLFALFSLVVQLSTKSSFNNALERSRGAAD